MAELCDPTSMTQFTRAFDNLILSPLFVFLSPGLPRMLRRSALLRFAAFTFPPTRSAKNSTRLFPTVLELPLPPKALVFPTSFRTFLDLHQFSNKEAIEKERARISDELSRGYFADISDIRKNGGKIAMANKTLTPPDTAIQFPEVEINSSDGKCLKLPITLSHSATDVSKMPNPSASLLCLSFRASSQTMAESWSLPFLEAFSATGKVKVYEVSFVDSWIFSLGPARRLFLKTMRKSSTPQREIVYSFGDHYHFRKKLHILNLLTGYIFLLDNAGRIRWQGFGSATEEEVSWLLSCSSLLLND